MKCEHILKKHYVHVIQHIHMEQFNGHNYTQEIVGNINEVLKEVCKETTSGHIPDGCD
jgi:hypothetical protein